MLAVITYHPKLLASFSTHSVQLMSGYRGRSGGSGSGSHGRGRAAAAVPVGPMGMAQVWRRLRYIDNRGAVVRTAVTTTEDRRHRDDR